MISELRGNAVVLRPFRPDELDELLEGRRRVGMLPMNRPGARRRLAALIDHSGTVWRGRLDLAIAADGRLVGEIDARSPEGAFPRGVYEIGISLFDPADRRRGFGSDAVETVTRWLFVHGGAERVQASTAVDNNAMRAVLRRLGFLEEGVLRAFMPSGDGTRDDYALYAVTRSDWCGRQRTPVG
jgi:RimJ/RimL family protein N-acetyltransferase